MKLVINESQFLTIIKEELGISAKVSKASEDFYVTLSSEVRNSLKTGKSNGTMKSSSGSFSYEFLGMKVSVSFEAFNFKDKDMLRYSQVHSGGKSVYVNDKVSFLWLTIPLVSGTIVKDETMDTIQHEFEHLFQQKMTGCVFSDTKKYAKISTNIHSEDENERKIAYMLYGCIKSEQEGFVNGLYAYLMSLPEIFNMTSLKKTPCWELYETMRKTYEEFEEKGILDQMLKPYGYGKKKVKTAIENFLKRIGRVVAKAKKDKYEKQGWRD